MMRPLFRNSCWQLGGLDFTGFWYYCGAVALVPMRGVAATSFRRRRGHSFNRNGYMLPLTPSMSSTLQTRGRFCWTRQLVVFPASGRPWCAHNSVHGSSAALECSRSRALAGTRGAVDVSPPFPTSQFRLAALQGQPESLRTPCSSTTI